jgi:hypothetical protein
MKSELQNLVLTQENFSNLTRERSKQMRRIKQISVKGLFETLDHVIPLNSERFRELLNRSKDPVWLKELRQSVSLRFIGTQRLLSLTQYKRGGIIPEVGMEPTVNKYAEELATAIRQGRDRSGSISQILDKTFPQRVLERQKSLPENELRQRLAEQEKKRLRLMTAGLLDQDKSSAFQMGDQMEEGQKKILSFAFSHFRKTQLYLAILNWQRVNTPFLVLRMDE